MTDLEQFKKEQLEREERHRRELNLIKDMLRTQNGGLRTPQSGLSFRIQQFEEEILRWSENLNSARVTRWGGMISTPDSVLGRVIRRSLIESGCPTQIVQDRGRRRPKKVSSRLHKTVAKAGSRLHSVTQKRS